MKKKEKKRVRIDRQFVVERQEVKGPGKVAELRRKSVRPSSLR